MKTCGMWKFSIKLLNEPRKDSKKDASHVYYDLLAKK